MNGNIPMRTNITLRHQTGLTLIEVMIAMLLGVFLIGGILQIFISTKQTYRMQENLSRLQENGRFAMDFISRDIRMADFRECATNPSVPTAIAGTNGAGTADTITITWSTAACGTATATTTKTYSIQNGAGGQPALFQNANELVEGVENLQILYGADTNTPTDGTPNYYVPAGTAGLNMAQVVSIRASLLLRTIDNYVAAEPLAYTYNGTTTTPPSTDRRIRRVFNSTLAVRNRLP
jgi:type IV pilus assembly protein PilW